MQGQLKTEMSISGTVQMRPLFPEVTAASDETDSLSAVVGPMV